MEAEDPLMLNSRGTLVSRKVIDLYRDMRRYATIFKMTNAPPIEEAVRALRAFKKAAQQLTTNSLLAGRESIILTIMGSDKDDDEDYDD